MIRNTLRQVRYLVNIVCTCSDIFTHVYSYYDFLPSKSSVSFKSSNLRKALEVFLTSTWKSRRSYHYERVSPAPSARFSAKRCRKPHTSNRNNTTLNNRPDLFDRGDKADHGNSAILRQDKCGTFLPICHRASNSEMLLLLVIQVGTCCCGLLYTSEILRKPEDLVFDVNLQVVGATKDIAIEYYIREDQAISIIKREISRLIDLLLDLVSTSRCYSVECP
jgi:hypothetical protein